MLVATCLLLDYSLLCSALQQLFEINSGATHSSRLQMICLPSFFSLHAFGLMVHLFLRIRVSKWGSGRRALVYYKSLRALSLGKTDVSYYLVGILVLITAQYVISSENAMCAKYYGGISVVFSPRTRGIEMLSETIIFSLFFLIELRVSCDYIHVHIVNISFYWQGELLSNSRQHECHTYQTKEFKQYMKMKY